MNRGDLPGYYWDQDKKRYFKIQANHLVPKGANYSKGSIKQDRRIAKKRKIEERNRLRQLPSVKSAAVLADPLGRVGISREQNGYARSHHAANKCEEAVVSQWTPKRIVVKPDAAGRRLADAHYLPERKTMICAFTSANGLATSIYEREWYWDESFHSHTIFSVQIAAFHSGLTSISTRTTERGCLIAASAGQHRTCTVFTALLPGLVYDDARDYRPARHFSPGVNRHTYDTAIHPERESVAVISSAGLCLLDFLQNDIFQQARSSNDDLDWPGCDTGIDWLDRNTLLYGAKEEAHSVMLWDTRSRTATASRFTVKERLTGVFTLSSPNITNPHEILASTNHRINLFDTRMPRTSTPEAPVLAFPHVHGGPRLQRAARGSLVAAVDRENEVHVYSIRTGKKVTQLEIPRWHTGIFESPAVRNLMWYDDPDAGSVLQAVRGNGVVRWAWRDSGQAGEEGISDSE